MAARDISKGKPGDKYLVSNDYRGDWDSAKGVPSNAQALKNPAKCDIPADLTNQNNVLGESGRLVARFANLVSAAGHALEHTGLVADIAGRAFPAARLRLEPLSESLGLLLLLLDELLLDLRLLSRRLDRLGSRLERAGKLNMI
ncbi:hypothetical protein WR25_26689 [Diploscapter pachys]|uniref:Uncharacterized protein n=1 Tax=Diploscapter pachys TaxID=2018661 RepID=A0A2A2L8Q3_9BILA|nr:hypothetical protein WR25_26689 [Diploscapter pachys]